MGARDGAEHFAATNPEMHASNSEYFIHKDDHSSLKVHSWWINETLAPGEKSNAENIQSSLSKM